MYVPKEHLPVKKRLTAQQRSKRTKAGVWLAFIVLAIGAAWGVWEAERAPRDATTAEQMLQHDLQALWTWSDDQLKNGSMGADWTVRWNATGKSGTMMELASKLLTDEKGKSVDKLLQNEGRTVTGTVPAYGGRISISIVEEGEDREQLMLLLETVHAQPLEKKNLLEATASISEELVSSGASFTSSMKVQGPSISGQAVQELRKLANAQSIDRYEDGGTVSETFYSGMLRSTIDTGSGNLANLQIALHKVTNSDYADLTIGIPVITGDYSSAAANQP
ncbi:YwmB family TATA-box binding protein [Paenibacillus alkaliterrae]|uniref:YwmB family TATA-box binding protein n=1 Tax=Paenibacillus alkaliterrae TaxID=320909 RepID=UPI001F22BBBF|nr:YwmB family TATA-box binding protein [Paenibacillus alkaliterrae]MCF2941283.1 YwmB family TATA-box binding protein [Paenibacillus alkaliterrae]